MELAIRSSGRAIRFFVPTSSIIEAYLELVTRLLRYSWTKRSRATARDSYWCVAIIIGKRKGGLIGAVASAAYRRIQFWQHDFVMGLCRTRIERFLWPEVA